MRKFALRFRPSLPIDAPRRRNLRDSEMHRSSMQRRRQPAKVMELDWCIFPVFGTLRQPSAMFRLHSAMLVIAVSIGSTLAASPTAVLGNQLTNNQRIDELEERAFSSRVLNDGHERLRSCELDQWIKRKWCIMNS